MIGLLLNKYYRQQLKYIDWKEVLEKRFTDNIWILIDQKVHFIPILLHESFSPTSNNAQCLFYLAILRSVLFSHKFTCFEMFIKDVFRAPWNIQDEAFSKNSERLSPVNYFCEKLHLRYFTGSEYASHYDTQYWFILFGILF